MKLKTAQTRPVQKINVILTTVIGLLVAVIAGGTVVTAVKRGGLTTPEGAPRAARPAALAAPPQAQSAGEQRIWTGMGRLRCPLKPEKGAIPATAVITVTFPYNDADIGFKQELARANVKFRAETVGLFASLPPSSPLLADESALKTTLLARYNAILRLDTIETLYFPDFLILE
jgi:flagellar basal body-associated protein FliL